MSVVWQTGSNTVQLLTRKLATITQPTIGNHEHKHLADVTDYWHGHPTFMSFTFGAC